jgi:hypothetical protein
MAVKSIASVKTRTRWQDGRSTLYTPEIVRVLLKIVCELFIIEKTVLISNAKEEPSQATESAVRDVLHEHTSEVATEWSNTGASGNHDMGCIWIILRKKHYFARGT